MSCKIYELIQCVCLYVQVVSEAHVKVSLSITPVNHSHFTKYYLDVTNDIGKNDVTLSLEEGAEPEPTEAPEKPGNEQTSKTPTTTTAKEPASPPS